MNIEELFKPIADYINFIVDFFKLHNLNGYCRLDSVNVSLVTYFFLGLFVGIVIGKLNALPAFMNDDLSTEINSSGSEKTNFWNSEILILIPLLLVGAIFSHTSLLICHSFFALDIGTFKDSINAGLAVGAIQYPIQAILNRIKRFAKNYSPNSIQAKIILASLHLFILTINIVLLFYYFRIISIFHDILLSQMLWPAITFMLLIAVFFGFLFILILISLKYLNPVKINNPRSA